MGFFNSEQSVFKLDDSGGTLRDITSNVLEVNGLPGSAELRDVTALGDTVGHKFHRALENVTFSLRLLFDDAATTGSNVVTKGLRIATGTSTFEFGPEGGTTGKLKWSGEARVTGYQQVSRVGSFVEILVDFQVDGGVTEGTFA